MNRSRMMHSKHVLNQKARRRAIHFRMIRDRMKLGPVYRNEFAHGQMRQNQRARRRMSLFRMKHKKE